MSFLTYLKNAVWDFLLVLSVSCALTYTLFDAFYIDAALQYSAVPALISVVLLVLLFFIAFDRRSMRWGVPSYVLVVLVLCGISIALSSGGWFLTDTENNYIYFALICILTPTFVFLLSRKRGGTAFLFIIGTAICAWVQFFYGRYELVCMLLFLIGSLALVIYKNYQLSARTATSVRRVSFPAGFGVACVSVLLATGLGAGVWFGVIAPLSPGALEIKLITEYRALQTLQVRGVSNVYQTPNLSMTSDVTNDEERTTDDMKVESDGKPTPAYYTAGTTSDQKSSGSFLGIDISSLEQAFNFQTNTQTPFGLLLFLLIPLLICAYFVGRRIWRRRRLAKIRTLDPPEQVATLYRFLVDRLIRIGFMLPAGSTVLEYASNNANGMERFDREAGVAFRSLTKTYTEVAYGGEQTISQEEADGFASFYKGFWKASRKYLGSFKYFLKSFKL